MEKKSRKRQTLAAIFGELKDNPPSILAKTARKKGKAAADKQRVAIAMSKMREMMEKKHGKMGKK